MSGGPYMSVRASDTHNQKGLAAIQIYDKKPRPKGEVLYQSGRKCLRRMGTASGYSLTPGVVKQRPRLEKGKGSGQRADHNTLRGSEGLITLEYSKKKYKGKKTKV